MADGRAASSQDGACGLNRPDETRRRSALRIALPPTRLLDTRTPLKSNSLQQFERRGSGEQPRARLGPSRLEGCCRGCIVYSRPSRSYTAIQRYKVYSYTSLLLTVVYTIQPLQHTSARLWHARIECEERVARLGKVGSGSRLRLGMGLWALVG